VDAVVAFHETGAGKGLRGPQDRPHGATRDRGAAEVNGQRESLVLDPDAVDRGQALVQGPSPGADRPERLPLAAPALAVLRPVISEHRPQGQPRDAGPQITKGAAGDDG